jgi:hypothetical protein
MAFRIGQKVKLTELPAWVSDLPLETQRIFQFCLGRVFSISEIDQHGLLVLDVSKEVDFRFGGFMNDIRIEPQFLEEV